LKSLELLLDSEKVEVAPGTTILAAAEARGILIPTFCHLKGLHEEGRCRVCVVEVDGEADLLPACSTPVRDGMVVRTSSRRTQEVRRTCVELLLSDHLGDCVGPCVAACPAGIDIPGFIDYLARGEDEKAYALILRDMPLPGVLGRICKRPCEDACRRQLVDEPVAICHLKRFAADRVRTLAPAEPPRLAPDSGKRVAVVGAGPAGLSAAFTLAILGHRCVVFDEKPRPGGLLRYGMPAFRLPPEIVDYETERIERLGIEFRGNTRLGRDVHLDRLCQEFDAIFLALGAQKLWSLRVPGEEAEGIVSSIDFLRSMSAGPAGRELAGQKIIVVGGGDVAFDVARVARRRGATDVHLYCLETSAEMPASAEEIREAVAEGIAVHHERGVKRFLTKGGKVVGVELMRCIAVWDESGAFRPRYDESETTTDDCTRVVLAVGQAVDLDGVTGVGLTRGGTLAADVRSHRTSRDKVFAGGDCTTGPRNAVEAIAAGRRAALSIDRFVRGQPLADDAPLYVHSMGEPREVPAAVVAGLAKAPRASISRLEPRARIETGGEVEAGLEVDRARAEAKRCLSCGCRDSHECRLRRYATLLQADGTRFPGTRREYLREEPYPGLVYESHKCISCESCIRISAALLGRAAMQVVGRGFERRIRPTLDPSRDAVGREVLARMVEGCPVGALTWKTDPVRIQEPVYRHRGPRASC
jgi:formate dehydrogenase major subunit